MTLKIQSYTLRVETPECTRTHRLWCAWCDTPMDGKGPLADGEPVSHSICPKCQEKKYAEMDELFGRE